MDSFAAIENLNRQADPLDVINPYEFELFGGGPDLAVRQGDAFDMPGIPIFVSLDVGIGEIRSDEYRTFEVNFFQLSAVEAGFS